MKNKLWIKLIVSLALPLAIGAIGSLFTASSIPTWYANLSKPTFAPPNWVFAPVWTTLFILMGIACFLIWKKGTAVSGVKTSLGIYSFQLLLNLLWSVIFFYLRAPGWAFLEIMILWTAILLTVGRFHKISRLAAWLLVPYLLWVSFASYLNFSIWRMNPSNGGQTRQISLPQGYTLENYSLEKTTGTACSLDTDCQTPPEYMAMSRCPFVSLCLNNQCAVVCPAYK